MQYHMRNIIFNEVRFCYGEICAVNSVNFSLKEKTLTAFIGPNGGGKSTLIKLLIGLLKPEEGSISFWNNVAVGYVSQNTAFDTSFPITVRDLVLMGTLNKKIMPFCRYTSRQKKIANALIKRVGLSGYENRGINQLSGGQLKRALIARALASDADVIVLDEPDGGLDMDASKELYKMLNTLKQEKTIVIASHRVDEILDISDSAVYINKTAKEYPSPKELKKKLQAQGGMDLC